MKLKFLILIFSCLLCSQEVAAADAGFRYIKTKGIVRCGSDLSTKTYAYKDESGYWRGIDADFCRLFSTAIFGRSDRFEMVDVKSYSVASAIVGNKIDIMLGNVPGTATRDVSSRATQAELLYYARQMLLAKKVENATSMEDYKGKMVCAVIDSEDLFNLQEYNEKYNLEFKTLLFRDAPHAKEAFLINRCDLLTGSEMYLKSIYEKMANDNIQIDLLPEIIANKPVYAQVDKNNQTLRIAVKWIINATILAERKGISSKNVDIFIGVKDASTRNLLGITPQLWNKFQLQPEWVKTAIKELGNYGEIYERNLGSLSDFGIERDKNRLIEDGGLISSQSFL